ncbi:MAG: radical SAM protein, partial [Bacteroidales bacterium]|nr:radical SAM protein [Bacteroidales bacterium]
MKERLLGKTPEELKQIALEAGLPAFAGKQIAQWLYVKRVRSIQDMTNLSKAGREALEAIAEVGLQEPIDVQVSADGTKKYLFPVSGDSANAVEAVMIPEGERKTLCVSSQAGCKMGCKFCMTGRQGFHGNLSAADILSQYFGVEEAGELTNTVFMGMGEPLDNWEEVKRVITVLTAPWGLAWSPKRITLSTIGVIPNLRRFLDECKCHLAVSLHNPFPEERLEMMPVQKAWTAQEVIR